MIAATPPSPTASAATSEHRGSIWLVFVALKWRLLRNGWRRAFRSPSTAIGVVLSFGLSAVGGIGGFLVASGVGFFDAADERLAVIAGASFVVLGWWFAPLLAGGVDETVDPTKLVVVPLTRSELRRGQIAAGLVGLAPMASVLALSGLVVGTAHGWWGLPFRLASVATLVALGVIGSRTIATTLAGLSMTRRGGDLAALLAALGGAGVFAALQLVRFADRSVIEGVVSVLRFTPPGLVAEGLVRGDSDPGDLAQWWRVLVGIAVCALASRWWSARLDRLLTEVPRPGTIRRRHGGELAIFDGLVRRHLPVSAAGASVAREMIYLARSAARRAVLASASMMGVAYVVAVAFSVPDRPPRAVLAVPVGAVFGMQYGVNQLGMDPQAFWMEMMTAPIGRARLLGRQLLCVLTVLPPVVVGGVVLGAITGGWAQMFAGVGSVVLLIPALAGVGSMISPFVVTPAPDNSNPFALRRASGQGCLAALGGFAFVAAMAALIAPLEVILWHVISSGGPVSIIAVCLGAAVVSGLVWWVATGTAVRVLARRDDAVFVRLDARADRA